MTHFRISKAIGAAAIALCVASPLWAQAASGGVSNTEGMLLGARVGGASLAFEGDKSENGGGAGFIIGYGFNSKFMLYVAADAAKIHITEDDVTGEYTLTHLDIGGRFSFANTSRKWVPYLNAALSGRSAGASINNTDVTISGPAFTIGGGVQYFFTPKVALDLSVNGTGGKFNKVKIGGVQVDVDDTSNSTSARVSAGLSFYPHFGH